MTTVMEDFGTETVKEGVRGKFRETLVKRAEKRIVHGPGVDGTCIVMGDQKLGDGFPSYTVREMDNGLHHCTCMDHRGGEFRGVCSHVVAVMIKKEDEGWERARDNGSDGSVTSSNASSADGANTGSETVTPSSTTTPSARFDPTDNSWGHPAFPDWVTSFRSHQEDAIEDILDAFERGAKVVFLDAPTGSGKTLIGEAVRRRIGGKGIYTCTTKTLQDQFIEDYPYAAMLKGRENYPTELAPFPDVTAGDCNGKGDRACNWCTDRGRCAYQVAKNRALGANLAVLNTAYLLAAWNGPRTFQSRNLVILDECDLLESALMGYVEVRIGPGKQRKYRINPPEKKTVAESWLEWVEETAPKIRRAFRAIPEDTGDIRELRERRWLEKTLTNLAVLQAGLEGEDVQWVYDQDRDSIVFKPVEVSAFGSEVLWQHGERFLLMSASIISAEEMAVSLGLDEEWDVVKVESTFPVDNRPVYPVFAGSVTNKTYDDVLPELINYTSTVINHHPGERVLVHTVSYRLAKDLMDGVKLSMQDDNRPLMTYSSSSDRETTLERMKSTDGAVVFAPSFDRGVDLPGDLCTVQVIAKVPYPHLGDKQVSTRLRTRGGQLWYAVQTVRSLVQMTGRGVRSATDTCTTYILDRQFQRFWNGNKRLFPDWWREAVDWTGRARSSLGL